MKKNINIAHGLSGEARTPVYALKTDNPFENLPDTAIWEALESNDRLALGFIYNKYMPDLYRFGFQLTAEAELVKDSIQDIFIAIGNKKNRTGAVYSIKSYLFRTLHRDLIRKLKTRKDVLGVSSDSVDHRFGININIESTIIRDELTKERIEQVQSGLNKLSEKQRQVILHHFFDGFTYDEIAGIMGLTHKNTVAKLIKRAISALKSTVASVVVVVLGTTSGAILKLYTS